jgi:putative transposase
MVMHVVPPSGGKVVLPTGNVLAMRARDPWREATAKAREVATQREIIVNAVMSMVRDGVTQNNAVALIIERNLATPNRLQPYIAAAMAFTAKKDRKSPTRSTICAWCADYKAEGLEALLPDHKGRVIESAAWWGSALEHYNNPSKPDMSAVYRLLLEVEGFAVTYDQVRHYLSSVPAMLGRNSPARIGKNLYRLTEKAYIRRSTEHALAGDVYVADGYRADVYLAHPVTGDIWRPELTVGMDLRSRVIVGWRADEHEGTIAVQNMWAEAFARYNHVPPFLYVDNGSGYKNKLMSDEATGFYARSGIQQIIHAIPGNPHGKGWIEQFFRIMKDDFLKLWRPHFYCGDDMAPEVLQHTVREIKASRLQLPTLEEFTDAFNAWLVRYENRPHPEDKSVNRIELWNQLIPIPPHTTLSDLKRQVVTLTVRRACVTHGKRAYGHPDMLAFNGEKVLLEYDLMVNEIGVIRTIDGRWICDAHLIKRIDALDTTRLEDKRVARAEDAIKRLEKKMQEQKDRAGHVIDADAITDYLTIEGESTVVDGAPLMLDLNDID